MTAGRPPKPIELHVINGNPGKRELPDPIDVPRERPQPPAHYEGEHLVAWNAFVDAVMEMGVCSSIDAIAMEVLVDSWCGYRRFQRELQENGYLETTNRGATNMTGAFRIRTKLVEETMRLLTEFGLTPVARTRLVGTVKKKTDDADPLMNMLRARAN